MNVVFLPISFKFFAPMYVQQLLKPPKISLITSTVSPLYGMVTHLPSLVSWSFPVSDFTELLLNFAFAFAMELCFSFSKASETFAFLS